MNNPCSQCQGELSLEDILAARMISEPLTPLQRRQTSAGAGAPILASEAFLKKHRHQGLAIQIARRAMPTDFENSFDEKRMIKAVSFDVTTKEVENVYQWSGLSLEKVGMVEPQDCYRGNAVVNPPGSLLAKGRPLGATGLAQCAEPVWQLRGEANRRQLKGAEVALQNNLGLGPRPYWAPKSMAFTHCLEEASAIWDAVPEAIRPPHAARMFVAAARHLGFTVLFFFRHEPPPRANAFYALVLLASALWMPATKLQQDGGLPFAEESVGEEPSLGFLSLYERITAKSSRPKAICLWITACTRVWLRILGQAPRSGSTCSASGWVR